MDSWSVSDLRRRARGLPTIGSTRLNAAYASARSAVNRRGAENRLENTSGLVRTPRVAIIGAGLSGIGMAAQLRRAGIDSFHVYERHAGVGGTWYANSYPGLFCDVPSRHYQYSFESKPDWSALCSPGSEIQRYIADVAAKYCPQESISFNAEVTEASWTDGRWLVRTAGGETAEYDFLIAATGTLVRPRMPDIPGIETFDGALFHSAEYDHSVQTAGKKVAVIGTGSTGLQLTKALAPGAATFELYQRTPQWIMPFYNMKLPNFWKSTLRRIDVLNRVGYKAWQVVLEGMFGGAVLKDGWRRRLFTRLCEWHLKMVKNPELRHRFTPSYRPMCKRLVLGSGFYQLFNEGTAQLVDTPISHVEGRGIVTNDGELHELDVIVCATGFDTQLYLRPMEVAGDNGIRLSDMWSERPFGYRSVGLPGFPNLLMLIGPHSPFGNQSLFQVSEVQQQFALRCIRKWQRGEFDAISPTPEATEKFNAELRNAMPGTIWVSGCNSWYLGADGLPSLWPWSGARHRALLQDIEAGEWQSHAVRRDVREVSQA